MNDEKKPFAVKDRRHFTTDGQLRDDAAAEAAPRRERADEAREPTREAAPPPADVVTLSSFVAGLAAQASVLMGLVAAPGEEAGRRDLDGARQIISILEMLREKTAGNRSEEEEKVFEAVLYELRMAYVSLAGGKGS